MLDTMAKRVLSRRKTLNMTQDDLAKLIQATRVAISNIELGNSTNIRATTLFALAKALTCDPLWLLTGEQSRPFRLAGKEQDDAHVRYVPLVDFNQVASWAMAKCDNDSNDIPMVPCPVNCSEDTFALRVVGDSMEPRFENGDLIFVDPALKEPKPGKFVIAMLPGEDVATFKEFQRVDGQSMLKALNPNYPSDMRYTRLNGSSTLIGLVVGHQKPV
ncbi:TPA: LexA family protein [Photobacterium damselae]